MLQFTMKKNILILIVVLIIFIFIYGVFVGTYKIFPYDILDSIKIIVLNEKIKSDQQNIVYENNISSLIHINTEKDILELKNKLIKFIWVDNGFPNSKLPDNIQINISNPLYDDFTNLKRILMNYFYL